MKLIQSWRVSEAHALWWSFIPEQTIVINGLSKISCHDRLAPWLHLCPQQHWRPNLSRVISICVTAAGTMNQYAMIEAWRKVGTTWSRRRNMWSVVIILFEKCPRLGLRWLSQMELSYLLKSQLVIIRGFLAFLQDFAREKAPALSGSAVNMVRYVRLSCSHMEVIKEAMKRFEGVYGRTCWSQLSPGNCPV